VRHIQTLGRFADGQVAGNFAHCNHAPIMLVWLANSKPKKAGRGRWQWSR